MRGLNLTGFLFGNIDAEGKLEADILDEESKKRTKEQNSKDGDGASSDSEDMAAKSPTAEDYSDINELAEDEGGPGVDDSVLMPPPPTPTSRRELLADAKKRLETPLAAMLPSKYANIDVRELFPDFRPDKVLSFSRLFGPGKPSSLPQIWRVVKNRRRRRKLSESEDRGSDGEESCEIVLSLGPVPSLDQCDTEVEENFLKPLDSDVDANAGKNVDEEKGPNVADWRFGPAQLWYDILGVAETGEAQSKFGERSC
jgi:transcription initiation factor TFIID subunit 1